MRCLFSLQCFRYDTSKARQIMDEVEAYLNSLWKDVDKDDEEKIARYRYI